MERLASHSLKRKQQSIDNHANPSWHLEIKWFLKALSPYDYIILNVLNHLNSQDPLLLEKTQTIAWWRWRRQQFWRWGAFAGTFDGKSLDVDPWATTLRLALVALNSRCVSWRSWNCHKLKVSKHDVSRVFYQVSQAENTEGAGTVVEDGQTLHVFVLSFCTRGMKSIQMLAIREKNKRRKDLTWLLYSVFLNLLV